MLIFSKVYGESCTVLRVIDGDTFETSQNEIIRLIGINTPEKNDIYFEESKSHLEGYILNKNVTLIKDTFSSNRDRNGRLLRYVSFGNEDVNLLMIRDGFAFAYLKFKFERSESYKQEQLNANNSGKGIWKRANLEPLNNSTLNSNNKIPEKLDLSTSTSKPTSYISVKGYFILFLILLLLSIGLFYSLKK